MERYVQTIFDVAGFRTERDRRFNPSGDVIHEIDISSELNSTLIIVECKDWQNIPSDSLKKELDALLGKMVDLRASRGIFIVSQYDEGAFERYRAYMERNNIRFWDAADLERIWRQFLRLRDTALFHKELCRELGLVPAFKEHWLIGLAKFLLLKYKQLEDYVRGKSFGVEKEKVLKAALALGINPRGKSVEELRKEIKDAVK